MAGTQDDDMPGQPDFESDFTLPHGAGTIASRSHEDHDPDSTEYNHHQQTPHEEQNDNDYMEGVLHSTETENEHDLYDRNPGDQGSYSTFEKGFSDDEEQATASARSPSERPFNLGFGLASSERGSPAPSEESLVIPPDDHPVYELRQNIERKKAFTYIDTDKSGNFDPEAELPKAKKSKKKGKGRARECKDKPHTMKNIVRLSFKAFGNVRNLTNDEDNWPDNWSDIDSDCEREIQEVRAFYRRNSPWREEQVAIEDPRYAVDDLTGYPAARGCKNCRKHEQDCSMIHGGIYPCQECIDDDCEYECQPIIPPTIKGTCIQCVDDGILCSFKDDQNQTICNHCADREFICEALPPKGYRAERIGIYELIAGSDRQYAQCTVCRFEKRKCSLRKKTDKPPCKYCKKHSIGCTFFDLPKSNPIADKAPQGPTDGDAAEVAIPNSEFFTLEDLADMNMDMEMDMDDYNNSSREPTPEVDMEDADGHRGALIKIQTSFAHPIMFNTIEQSPNCNFCEMPAFSFCGFFEKTVHVLKWSDGLGCSEIAAGHREDNDATTMCQECVMGRVQVICCSDHDIQRINEPIPDFDEAANDLMLADPRSIRYQLQRWCSMCFSVAAYKCCAEGDDATIGCGFRLCQPCEAKFRLEYGGDVDAIVTAYDKLPKMAADTPDGTWVARADVGFLRKEGLLMRNVEVAMAAEGVSD